MRFLAPSKEAAHRTMDAIPGEPCPLCRMFPYLAHQYGSLAGTCRAPIHPHDDHDHPRLSLEQGHQDIHHLLVDLFLIFHRMGVEIYMPD